MSVQWGASPIWCGLELAQTLDTLVCWCGKALMWADHLTIARCCACMAELDLSAAITTMGAGLHLLQRDLILESVRVELVQEVVQSA